MNRMRSSSKGCYCILSKDYFAGQLTHHHWPGIRSVFIGKIPVVNVVRYPLNNIMTTIRSENNTFN